MTSTKAATLPVDQTNRSQQLARHPSEGYKPSGMPLTLFMATRTFKSRASLNPLQCTHTLNNLSITYHCYHAPSASTEQTTTCPTPHRSSSTASFWRGTTFGRSDNSEHSSVSASANDSEGQ
mmetsp:Transcript_8990/g.17570  ORF Transcript_8990/g.17570 Transcript_8990/m.17570 type:complete len:122 (-) Transcript_8990:178-543(-)